MSLWVTALTDPGIIPANPSNARALPPEGEVSFTAAGGKRSGALSPIVCPYTLLGAHFHLHFLGVDVA